MKEPETIAKQLGIFFAWLIGIVGYLLLMIWIGFVLAFQHWLINARPSFWYCSNVGEWGPIVKAHTKFFSCNPQFYQANYVHPGLIIVIVLEIIFTVALLVTVFSET